MEEKTKATPTVRYSDEELEEFKALILEKLQQARENLARLNENIAGGEHSTDDTALCRKKRKTPVWPLAQRNTYRTSSLL